MKKIKGKFDGAQFLYFYQEKLVVCRFCIANILYCLWNFLLRFWQIHAKRNMYLFSDVENDLDKYIVTKDGKIIWPLQNTKICRHPPWKKRPRRIERNSCTEKKKSDPIIEDKIIHNEGIFENLENKNEINNKNQSDNNIEETNNIQVFFYFSLFLFYFNFILYLIFIRIIF